MIAGVFLAAGRGKRFGSNKLLHEVQGKPIVYYGLKACVESSLPHVYVVLETGNDKLRSAVENLFPDNHKLSFVENESPELGMMHSLKLGIKAAENNDGVMVCLADMPQITPNIIDTILAAFTRGKIVLPVCENRPRHPRILPQEIFPDFLHLESSAKGTSVLDRHPEKILRVSVGEKANYADVDRLRDLDGLDPGLWA